MWEETVARSMIKVDKPFVARQPGDNTMVDVSGVDRDKLLEALWRNSKPSHFFASRGMPAPIWNLERAKSELRGTYADYCCGRCIKTDVYTKDNVIDGWLYDRDNGQGAFERIVKTLKNQ
jgi:hypothetical protein